ncbi:MAG: hypothetical protein ACKO3P_13755 [Planctomycetaceae bacterium]
MSLCRLLTRCLPLLLALGSFGCQIHHAAPVDSGPRVAVVDVGGFVGHPGPVEIPPTGLTLYQAIIRARGVSFQSLGMIEEPDGIKTVVRLHRGRELWVFPQHLVQNDLAGQIQLAPGDIVDVVRLGDTTLVITTDRVDEYLGNIEILGDHPYAGVVGVVQLKRDLEVRAGNALSVKTLAELETLESRGLSSSANVVVLTRVNPRNGALTEHYVLPADNYGWNQENPGGSATSLAITNSAILANDRFEFTTLSQLPVIQAGLLAPVVKQLIDAGVPPEECHRRIREAVAKSR